ncbi:hypothetical protein EMMF5_002214 [Cystobasidiomycetes sp. EMM_F5]
MKYLAASAAIAALVAGVSATQSVPRDAGPSGYLTSPAGDTTISTTDTGNGGIWVEYIPVNINYGYTYAATYGIAASLVSVDGKSTYLLSNGEAVNPKTGKINAFLKTPKGACGDYRLVIDETQYYKGQILDFRSQAPLLHINCAVTP